MTDSKHRLVKALLRQPTDRTPIWIMRQAGRYLPEYREVRKQAGSFMGLATNPELACEVTLQPLRRFDLDAAILFSDILTIPDAMGLGLHFVEGEGPQFKHPLRNDSDIINLPQPDPETELRYVMDAVRLIRSELDERVPLIGFSGSPWTLATYMIEGRGSKDFARAKALLNSKPELAHRLLGHLSDAVTSYLNAQIEAGVQIVQIFDSWGGALPYAQYREFSLAYMKRIISGLTREKDGQRIPVILFSKGCNLHLDVQAASGCDAIGVDWTISLDKARAATGGKVALQGNLDPAALLSEPEGLRRAVSDVLASYGNGSGHVFNLGHGITPQVAPEQLGLVVSLVHELSPQYHA